MADLTRWQNPTVLGISSIPGHKINASACNESKMTFTVTRSSAHARQECNMLHANKTLNSV